eukprot:4017455-Amphidinium_carterae.1
MDTGVPQAEESAGATSASSDCGHVLEQLKSMINMSAQCLAALAQNKRTWNKRPHNLSGIGVQGICYRRMSNTAQIFKKCHFSGDF